MSTSPMNGGITFEPRLTLPELKQKLITEQAKLAEVRKVGGALSLSERMAKQKEIERQTAGISALQQQIRQLETKGSAETATRRQFAEVQQSMQVINDEITALIARRNEYESSNDSLVRKINRLGKSKSVGELKVVEERQLEEALTESGRLLIQIRSVDGEIETLRLRCNQFNPECQRLSQAILGIEDKTKLDALRADLDMAVSNRVAADELLGACEREEARRRFLVEVEQDNQRLKREAEQRNQMFIAETERRKQQQREVLSSPAPIGAHL